MEQIKTIHGDSVIITRLSSDEVYSIIEDFIVKNNIIRDELTYKKNYVAYKDREFNDSNEVYPYKIELFGHNVDIYKTILFYFIGDTCVLTNITYNNFILYRALNTNKVYFHLFYNDEFDNPLTIDHIDPVSKSENNTIDNLQPMSLKMNKMKSDRSDIVMKGLAEVYGADYMREKYGNYGQRQDTEDDGSVTDLEYEFVGMYTTKIIDTTKSYYKGKLELEYSRGEIICRKLKKVIKGGKIIYSIVMIVPNYENDTKFNTLIERIHYVFNNKEKYFFLYNPMIHKRFKKVPQCVIKDENIIDIIFG